MKTSRFIIVLIFACCAFVLYILVGLLSFGSGIVENKVLHNSNEKGNAVLIEISYGGAISADYLKITINGNKGVYPIHGKVDIERVTVEDSLVFIAFKDSVFFNDLQEKRKCVSLQLRKVSDSYDESSRKRMQPDDDPGYNIVVIPL